MGCLPRLKIFEATLCQSDGEDEGWTVHVRWGRLVIEFTFARRVREVAPR